MDINKKNRADLKSYFIKNSIPTESNFAELIDGMLNQKDDGIVKLSGDPLSIEAAGDLTGLQKVINFYAKFQDANPSWSLQLNPRTDPNTPVSAKAGFCVADGKGAARLFIDQASGNIGLGVVNPNGKLDVAGQVRIGFDEGGSGVRSISFARDAGDEGNAGKIAYRGSFGQDALHIVGAGAASGPRKVKLWDNTEVINLAALGAITPSNGNSVNNGILFKNNIGGDTTDSAWIRYYARSAEQMTLEIGTANDDSDHIALMPSGNVGIGLNSPVYSFDVKASKGIKLGLEGLGGGQLILKNNRDDNKIYMEAFSSDGSASAAELLLTGINGASAPKISLVADVTNMTGNAGIGLASTATPIAKLDIAQAPRSGAQPAAVKGLYITGDFGPDADGVEFRHSNGSQGIGFGYNTIYATGGNTDQNLQLKPKGAGVMRVLGAANISNGSDFANSAKYMSSGSLTIGGINSSFGGGDKWSSNTAGLLLETQANTEIAVHDSGERLASLMYYQGDAVNKITIGRNMGWGVTSVAIAGDITFNGNVALGCFSGAEVDEWPKFTWYRDTANHWDEGLIKHGPSRGFFGRSGFGIHLDASRDWTFFSTNFTPLLGIEGGSGNTKIRGNLTVNCAITPSAGNSENNGIMFPKDPAGGGGDAAWLRYYARTGESMTLEIGTANDNSDHIALMPSGNVGIGTNSPLATLDVEGVAFLGYANSILNFGNPLKSGFYQGVGDIVGDVPDTTHPWSHMITSRHANTANNHQLQLAATFSTNDKLYFRKIAANEASNPAWNEVATRGTNTFSGNQSINGNLVVNGTIISDYYALSDTNYTIELCGSAFESTEGNTTFLKINSVLMNMPTLRGLNTVILYPDGTVKITGNHDVYANAATWNTWAAWVNANAALGDVVAVASYDAISNAPRGDEAEYLLTSILADRAFTVSDTGQRSPYTLLFMKGGAAVEVNSPYRGSNAHLGKISQELVPRPNAWRDARLINGWVNFGGGYNPPQYFKDNDDVVWLRGLVKSGSAQKPIFVLPDGCRPNYRQLHSVCSSDNVIGRVDILPNGQVSHITGGTAWLSLDSIAFRAAP